jgi:Ulp1 family protease
MSNNNNNNSNNYFLDKTDLQRIQAPNSFLNDNIINFYLKFLWKTKLNKMQQEKIVFLYSGLSASLNHSYERLANRVDELKNSFVVFPFHLSKYVLFNI